MKNVERYIIKLQEQFFQATGMRADVANGTNIKEFKDWIKVRQNIGEEYVNFLEYLQFDFKEAYCVEVEKGRFDSIVKPFETTILTPYYNMPGVDDSRILPGNFGVMNYSPYIFPEMFTSTGIHMMNPESFRVFMTQNIYTLSQIAGWEDLHNSGEYNIICGAYGSLWDKDSEGKVQQLRYLKRKLTGEDITAEYAVSNDRYYFAIGSKRKVKKYEKTK